ncbi:hypothetical protein [Bacillus sp. T3]|uniref:hypothetical protein n=1 Tax=Bacillus sp. T3 TaxID=467262 RepID=UPI002981F5C1|nr:hypothetical protein [Bacillus sp. T3]
MKSLSLEEILAQIGKYIVHGQGDQNLIIKRAMDWTSKEIDDHTLVFHMDHERIRGKSWKDNKAIVIITDKPELCTGS